MTEGVKFCSKCNSYKLYVEFYRSKQTPSGLTSRCKDCMNSYARGRHVVEKRKERARDRMKKDVDPDYVNRRTKASRKYYASQFGKARNLWLSAKKSKASKRMSFTLTFEHVLEGVQRGSCAVTGLPFDLTPSINRYRNAYAPSLDRIDPKGPYSNENVRVVLNQFNAMKGEISDFELYVIAKAFIERTERR